MIERGVDVNRKDEDGKTLLQKSAARFKKLTVKELLKAPGIDKTGVPEEVEKTMSKLIEKASTEEKKAQFREEANDLIALVKGSSGGYRRRKKTRVRSKRIRKTRRRSKV
jgi:ankyrin repeat protein